MWLFVGLGNPGRQYKRNRHNFGFMVVERMAEKEELCWKGWDSFVYAYTHEYVLVKPVTFMNLSGKAVREAMRYWRCGLEDLVVIYDDIDLPLGTIRLRRKGGSGGHKGLASVISYLGSEEFGRMRLGIARGEKPQDLASYVLSDFDEEEWETVELVIERAIDGLHLLMEQGWDRAMNEINSKSLLPSQEGGLNPQGGINGNSQV